MTRSANGYSANDRSKIKTYTVPGTTRRLAVRIGDVSRVLLDVAAWFDINIERLVSEPNGVPCDDWGYAERNVRGSALVVSNHASGTAIDLNALRHPMGRQNTFSLAERRRIRARLKVYEGTVRWGGDYKNRKDEMHFEINAGPLKVGLVARKLHKFVRLEPVVQAAHNSGAHPDVAIVQRALNKVLKLRGGARLSEDGVWGRQTAAAYRRFKHDKLKWDTSAPGHASLVELGKRSGLWNRVL
jgi:D-alanyl-D-alanine carboxypeptidase